MKYIVCFIVLISNVIVLLSQINPIYHQGGFNNALTLSECSPNTDFTKILFTGGHGYVRIVDGNTGNLMGIIQKKMNNIDEWDYRTTISSVALSPDGNMFVTEDLEIWDIKTEQLLKKLELSGFLQFRKLRYDNSGNYIIGLPRSGYGYDKQLMIWDVNSSKIYKIINLGFDTYDFKLSVDNESIYFFDNSDNQEELKAYKYNFLKEILQKEFNFTSGTVQDLIIVSRNEKYIINYGNSSNSHLYSISNGNKLFEISRLSISNIIFSNDEKYIIYGDNENNDYIIKFQNIENQNVEKIIKVDFLFSDLFISNDDSKIIVGNGKQYESIDISSGEITPLISHFYPIGFVFFTPDSKYFISLDNYSNNEFFNYGIIQKFDLGKRKKIWQFSTNTQLDFKNYRYFNPYANSIDGKYFAYACFDKDKKENVIELRDTDNGRRAGIMHGCKDVFTEIRFSDDMKFLYASSLDSTIRKWNLNDFSLEKEYKLNGSIFSFTLTENPDKIIVFYRFNNNTSLFEYSFSDSSYNWLWHINSITDLIKTPYAFSGNKKYFASNIFEENWNTVVIDIQKNEIISVLDDINITAAAFSDDNKKLITITSNIKEVNIWNIENRKKEGYIHEYLRPQVNLINNKLDSPNITSIAFSPDGRYFAFGNDEPAVLIYDTQTLDVIDEYNNNIIDNSNVFPNPVKSHAEIKLADFYAVMPSISIYNIYGGRQDVPVEFISAGNTQKLVLNNLNLTPGFYIYTVTGDSRSQSGSFVVVN